MQKKLSLQRDLKAYLWDVCLAADEIFKFTKDMTEEGYAASSITHSAVERKFEIIGEALNLLSKLDPKTAARIPELSKIVAFRNILIHGYAIVDHERVWAITKDELLSLREIVGTLFSEL